MRIGKSLFLIVLAPLVLQSCAQKGVPIGRKPVTDPDQLKVMSYNIHHANPPSEKPEVINLDTIAAVIRNEAPDIVCLQEVDRFTKRSGNVDEAKIIASKARYFFRFFKAIDYDGGDYGLAILSRYPIDGVTQVALPQVMKGEARILAHVNIMLANKRRVIFANTHLDAQRSDSNRVAQIKRILTEFDKVNVPVVISGDFNSEAGKETIELLDQQFKRSCTENCGFTIPERHPIKTIDYIALKNASWQVKDHHVVAETYASDHRPVVVTYQMK